MKIDGADRDWLLTPPSYEPELRRLMVDAPWIAEHVTETGTHREAFWASRRPAALSPSRGTPSTASMLIADVWGSAFHVHLLEQLR